MPSTGFATAIGTCHIAWHDTGLTAFRLPAEQPAIMAPALPPSWVQSIIERVRQHLAGNAQDFSDLPYDFGLVADFPQQVYRVTLQVKPGQTCSYGDIAKKLGQPPAVSRAVGSALGANPWPLLVPCHRVVASDGKMTGFSGPGGIKTKLRLLAIEGAQLFTE
ncbi:MAG: methylated-DNA--[protein]-cysteine S-methyltransferase [Opitutaceae bacterium]|nr:methylated-DNA--[protein]-cysteine S-methyltransferase [Opitutaceae bacterium]MBP9913891.1 methylated-DNA--[protein]-cysteine S-methyltransferase [Opitutaceae bacterium]